MKNKETIIGWVLIVILMIGFIMYQSKRDQELQKKKREEQKTMQADSIRAAANRKPVAPPPVVGSVTDTSGTVADSNTSAVNPGAVDTSAVTSTSGRFNEAAKGEEKTFVIEDSLLKITLTNKGGQIKSLELKTYKTWDKKPLILFSDKTSSISFLIPVENNEIIDTRTLYFDSAAVISNNGKSIALRLSAGEGKYFELKYSLTGNSYLFNYEVNMVGFDSIIPGNNQYVTIEWQSKLSRLEMTLDAERRYSALYYKAAQGDVKHLDDTKEDDEYALNNPMEWISYKQEFFNTTLFSKTEILPNLLKTHFITADTHYVKSYEARFNLPYQQGKSSYSFQIFAGPNHYNTLKAMDKDVEDIIRLGPDFWMFSWIKYITRFIIWVFQFFDRMHLNYGIIILLLTLILKIALHPLTAKSIESAAKMKILAPEIAALKEKYGEDQTKIGQETMKLYQRAGVNPLGGCLPILLQMPILIAMYNFFPSSIELRQQSFLWATDLSSYDSIVSWGTPILGQSHLSLFTLLMTITSILQAVMSNQLNAMQNQQPGMKYMPYFMPLMLMFLFNSFPAALTYYYLLQNVLGITHQWLIQKFFIDDAKLRKQIEDNKKNPKAKSGWQKKLADIQSQAEQRSKAKR